MLMIKETQFTQSELEKYFSRGYRCAVSDGKNFPKVYAKEPVSFILDSKRLYSINIRNIEYLIYTNHPVNIKLGDKTWTKITKEEWRHSFKDSKSRRYITHKHEVLLAFEAKRDEYFEFINLKKAKDYYDYIVDNLYPEGLPTDEEIRIFIDTWSKAYDIQVDFDDTKDVLVKYKALKFYVDNGLDVSNPDAEPDIIYVGKEKLFEDLIYKSKERRTHEAY